ncbi:GNAT family N-acetyltransferase [candidate division KSB1 bacterium]|nr:GNAT family N-acetyltransferase [candidate division KSB1 bacterium]
MTIRTMQQSDIEFVYQCVEREGWTSETHDTFTTFIDYHPDGCFIAEQNDQNVGLCVATPYRNHGFIGELIVIKEMRGTGIGKALFTRAIDHLHSCGIEHIYLDGVPAAVPIYEKYGFRKVCKSLRYIGNLAGEVHDNVRLAKEADLKTVCEIDTALFGDDRSFILTQRFKFYPHLFFVLEIDDRIQGYIAGQPGIGLVTAGPWAMLTDALPTDILLKQLALAVGNQTLRIGVLESNEQSVETMNSLKTLEMKFFSWRMVLGTSADLGMHAELLAIGSPATG